VDDAEFDRWLSRIAALSPSQRRRAWQALALSEASEDHDGCAGASLNTVPERAGMTGIGAPGEPRAATVSPAVARRGGAGVVAGLGQRRIDSLGCPHCASRDVVGMGEGKCFAALPL